MLQTFKNGQGSIILRAKLLNSSVTTGAGVTGLSSASTGLIISTIADNEATATTYTVAGSTIETITTLGTYAAPTATKCRFKEVDATNHPGVYEFQFADARFAVSSAKSLLVSVSGATNLAQADFVIQLQSDDPFVAKPANYASLSIDANGRVDVIKVAGTTQTAGDIPARLPAALTAGGNIKADAQVVSDKTGYSLTQAFPTNFASLAITAGGAVTAGTVSDKTGYSLTSQNWAVAGDAMTLTAAYDFAKGTAAMTEAYAADGAAMTPAQALFMIWAFLAEKNISGTTMTVKKLDGLTSAMTFTLDAATPSALTRAT